MPERVNLADFALYESPFLISLIHRTDVEPFTTHFRLGDVRRLRDIAVVIDEMIVVNVASEMIPCDSHYLSLRISMNNALEEPPFASRANRPHDSRSTHFTPN